jgi:hypothetical protein
MDQGGRKGVRYVGHSGRKVSGKSRGVREESWG